MDIDPTPFDDLVNQAEQLTAEFSAEPTFPRVERNLKQLAEVGQQLWSRTALHAPKQTSDVRASVLLGGKGYDLQKVTQKLELISGAKTTMPVESITESDTQGFLKSERENAILSAVEEVKKSTMDAVDKLYWECLESEWESEKLRILNSLVGTDKDTAEIDLNLSSTIHTPAKQQSQAPNVLYQNEQELDQFVSIVCKLIREKQTRQVNKLLGFISDDGCRITGEIDRNQNFRSDEVILRVANECEKQGFLEESVQLYDLAGEHDKVLKILNKLLSSVVAEKQDVGSQRERLELLSLKLADRYTIHGSQATKSTKRTFFLLLDLLTFFSYYHKQAFNDALTTIEKLELIPFQNSAIELKVAEFGQLTEEIRHNIPEVLLASMNILYAQYKEAKTSVPQSVNKFGIASDVSFRQQRCDQCREKARTLITYAGMIPYRMPGNTNAKLVQLEVLMQ